MRLSIAKFLVLSLVLFGASSASALQLSLVPSTPLSIPVGGTVTFTLRLNTDGETQVTSVFTSISNSNPGAVGFQSGTSPGAILLNTSTFISLSRVVQPQINVPGDAPGQIRAANFVTPEAGGSGVSNANALLATITMVGLAPGTATLANLLVIGNDEVTVAQVSVTGSVVQNPGFTITVIPEPGTALLMGLGLMGLAAAGRRSA